MSVLEGILVDGHEPELGQLLDLLAHDDRGCLIHDSNLSFLRYLDADLDLLCSSVVVEAVVGIPKVLDCNASAFLNLVHDFFITVFVVLLLWVEISVHICGALNQ